MSPKAKHPFVHHHRFDWSNICPSLAQRFALKVPFFHVLYHSLIVSSINNVTTRTVQAITWRLILRSEIIRRGRSFSIWSLILLLRLFPHRRFISSLISFSFRHFNFLWVVTPGLVITVIDLFSSTLYPPTYNLISIHCLSIPIRALFPAQCWQELL